VSSWSGAAASAEADGIRIHRVGGRYGYAVAAPRYYRKQLADERFDVIIEDLNKVPLFAPWWVRSPLVLLVHHLFGTTAFGEAPLPVAAATWLLERPIPLVYRGVPTQAVSPSTASDLAKRGFSTEDLEVIPNGVDLAHFARGATPPRFDRPTLLYMGRLRAYKGVDLVLRSLPTLREGGRDVRFVVAGKGPDEGRLKALARSLGVESAVDFAGFVDEDRKVDLLRRSWVHVLPSVKEGWGLTVLEAGAAGTPSVVSDSPGLRDSVVDRESGLRTPHGDVAALAAAIGRLLDDESLREELGRGALRFAERHGWDAAAERTERHLLRHSGKELP
jgi:glycosyltransferase involved in cell wall biosynthesis